MVPMEWVERAERILRDTTRPRKRLGNEDFRLTGRLYHEDGSAMVGTSGTGHRGRAYHYYRCRECGRTVRHDAIEPRVADAVRAAFGREDIRDRIAALMVEYEREREGDSPQSARLEAELRGIHSAYANKWKAIEDGMAPPGGRERIDALRARQELLEEELEEARRIERVRLDPDRVRFWLGSVAGSLDDDAALCSFVSRVVLRDGDGDPFDVAFTFDESAGGLGEDVRVDSPALHHKQFGRACIARARFSCRRTAPYA